MNAFSRIAICCALAFPLVNKPVALSGQEATKSHIKSTDAAPIILVQPPVNDAFVQWELGRLGGEMVERGQLLPKSELLKLRATATLTLPRPSVAEVAETA